MTLERRTMTCTPEISGRGSLILWAECQIPVGPRERNVGPSTIWDISLSSTSSDHTLYEDQVLHIFKTVPVFLSMWYLHCVLKDCISTHALFQNYLFQGHYFIPFLKSFFPVCGTFWYEIQRDTAIKTWHTCVAIRRWYSERANFTSLGKETTLNTHIDCAMPPSFEWPSRAFCSHIQATFLR